MKWKKNIIQSGMIIHCMTEEDAKALLKYLDSLGYKWPSGESLTRATRYYPDDGRTYYRVEAGHVITSVSDDILPVLGKNVTELSDLVEPEPTDSPMTAKEVMEWLNSYMRVPYGADNKSLSEIFDVTTLDGLFACYDVDEIIQKIAVYEATKKVSKALEYGKACYISVRSDECNGYGSYSKFEYWPGEQDKSYEDLKADYISRAVRETGKQIRVSEYDICRMGETRR